MAKAAIAARVRPEENAAFQPLTYDISETSAEGTRDDPTNVDRLLRTQA